MPITQAQADAVVAEVMSRRAYTAAPRYTAGRRGGAWVLLRAGAKRALRVGMTKREAWNEARRRARGAGGIAYLLSADTGRIVARNDYGASE